MILPPNYGVDEFGNRRETTPDEDRIARRVCAHYWGLVALIDDMVTRIIAALEERGMLRNTLILYFSDHGEMLFDFGRKGKSNFYEPVIRVPLIAVPPECAGNGSTVKGLVELDERGTSEEIGGYWLRLDPELGVELSRSRPE